MTKNRLLQGATSLSGVLALLLLASCGEMPWAGHGGGYDHPGGGGVKVFNKPVGPKGNGHYECQSGSDCELTIDVASCKVVEDLTETKKGQVVRWTVPDGWTFAEKGIEFDPAKPDPSQAFDNGHRVGHTKFQWHVKPDAVPKADGYKYRVRVTGPGGKSCDFDPSLWV